MNYKVEGAIKRNRKNFIIFAILWIFIAIVFVSPIAYSYHMSIANGTFDLQIFIEMLIKSTPKNEYSDIEHGSSDWSQRGEQYKILDKNKGIVLAENNYLPVDKRGNVNVLVVGRIRFW